jgi:hypothetical protein
MDARCWITHRWIRPPQRSSALRGFESPLESPPRSGRAEHACGAWGVREERETRSWFWNLIFLTEITFVDRRERREGGGVTGRVRTRGWKGKEECSRVLGRFGKGRRGRIGRWGRAIVELVFRCLCTRKKLVQLILDMCSRKKLISLKKLIMGVFCSASYQTHVRSAALRAVHGSIKRKMIYKNHFIEPFYWNGSIKIIL